MIRKIPLDVFANEMPEKFAELRSIEHNIAGFMIFTKATKLGIRFRPEDIDIKTLHLYSAIQEQIEEYQNSSNTRMPTHGRK